MGKFFLNSIIFSTSRYFRKRAIIDLGSRLHLFSFFLNDELSERQWNKMSTDPIGVAAGPSVPIKLPRVQYLPLALGSRRILSFLSLSNTKVTLL